MSRGSQRSLFVTLRCFKRKTSILGFFKIYSYIRRPECHWQFAILTRIWKIFYIARQWAQQCMLTSISGACFGYFPNGSKNVILNVYQTFKRINWKHSAVRTLGNIIRIYFHTNCGLINKIILPFLVISWKYTGMYKNLTKLSHGTLDEFQNIKILFNDAVANAFHASKLLSGEIVKIWNRSNNN